MMAIKRKSWEAGVPSMEEWAIEDARPLIDSMEGATTQFWEHGDEADLCERCGSALGDTHRKGTRICPRCAGGMGGRGRVARKWARRMTRRVVELDRRRKAARNGG